MSITSITANQNTHAAYAATNSAQAGKTGNDYLNELREKYPSVNIAVKDLNSAKDFENYAWGCGGFNNLAISKHALEKAVNDPATAAKIEKLIEDLPNTEKIMKERASEIGHELTAGGVIVDKNGNASYWCMGKPKEPRKSALQEQQKAQKEIEKQRETDKENARLEEEILLKADSQKQLLEKISAARKEQALPVVDGFLNMKV